MSFFGTNQLSKLLKEAPIIIPFEEGNIKNGAYELRLGEQVFQTDSKPRSINNLAMGQEIYIAPGQFSLLLTEEIVDIPTTKIAFISIKAGIKFKGLVNVSGFHVDPGFNGKLLFSVYNAGPSTIVLQRGQKCFPMWFADLNDTQKYRGEHEKQLSIPLEPVAYLSQGDLASPSALLEKIKDDYKALDTKINQNEDAQKARIGLIEEKQKPIDYLVKTVISLCIVILFKFILDWAAYERGVSKGEEMKQEELKNSSSLNSVLMEKRNLLLVIDSLQKVKDSMITKN